MSRYNKNDVTRLSNVAQIIYCLIALYCLNKEGSAFLQERWGLCNENFNKSLLDELAKNETQGSDSRFNSNVWNEIFFKYILQQTNSDEISIFNTLLGCLLQYDPSQLSARFLRFPCRSKSLCSSPPASLESVQTNVKAPEDTFYKKFCDQIAQVPKNEILEIFFVFMEKAMDRQDTVSCDPLIGSCLKFPTLTLENVLSYILKCFNVTTLSPSVDISSESFRATLEFTATLTSLIAKSDMNRTAFNSMFAIPLIITIFSQLEKNTPPNTVQSKDQTEVSEQNHGTFLPVKICLRLIANLSYKNCEIQDEVWKQKGCRKIL
jgi:hypothetical protein